MTSPRSSRRQKKPHSWPHDDDESVDELENSHDTGDVDVEFLPSVESVAMYEMICKDSVVAVHAAY